MLRINKTKICPVCNIEFTRPSGKSDKVWNKQKCCSGNCASLYIRVANPIRLRARVNLVPGENKYKGWRKK